MKLFSLNKYEKLKSKKIIDAVFEKGGSIYKYPFKIYYLPLHYNKSPYPAQVGFGASKRNFKRAVDRNLIKRRMREVYRYHKPKLYTVLNDKELAYAFMMIYTAREIHDIRTMEDSYLDLLGKLIYNLKHQSS